MQFDNVQIELGRSPLVETATSGIRTFASVVRITVVSGDSSELFPYYAQFGIVVPLSGVSSDPGSNGALCSPEFKEGCLLVDNRSGPPLPLHSGASISYTISTSVVLSVTRPVSVVLRRRDGKFFSVPQDPSDTPNGN